MYCNAYDDDVRQDLLNIFAGDTHIMFCELEVLSCCKNGRVLVGYRFGSLLSFDRPRHMYMHVRTIDMVPLSNICVVSQYACDACKFNATIYFLRVSSAREHALALAIGCLCFFKRCHRLCTHVLIRIYPCKQESNLRCTRALLEGAVSCSNF